LESLLSEGAVLSQSSVQEALQGVERSVCETVRAAAADASDAVKAAMHSQQEAVLSAVRSVGESVEKAGDASQLSQEDLKRVVEQMRGELTIIRATADDILKQVLSI
jgi:rRNA maturation endonuclease Nob1